MNFINSRPQSRYSFNQGVLKKPGGEVATAAAFETHHLKEYLFMRKAEGEIDSSDSDTDTENDSEKDTVSTSLLTFLSFESYIS